MTTFELQELTAHVGGFRLGPQTLTVGTTDALAVVGPSGAGKTTFLRALAGLLPSDGGELRRDGEPITEHPPEQRRLGYVPQGLGLFPHLSVARNVGYAAGRWSDREVRRTVRDWLARFGILPLADRRPGTISEGERQRVAMARALAAEAELILWDEPLSALDVQAREELLELLNDVRRHEAPPLLVVTHDPEVAFSLAPRVHVLDRGSVEYSGPVDGGRPARLTPFLARFLGYDNVLAVEALQRLPPALAGPLAPIAGPAGVAFSSSAVRLDPAEDRDSWRVVRREPRGDEVVLLLERGSVTVRARGPAGATAAILGDRMGVQVDLERVRAVGEPRRSAEGS